MDARIKGLWTAALRSGEFQQGMHVLRNSRNEFCCLGVLCEIAVREGVIPEPKLIEYGEQDDRLDDGQVYKYADADFYPPPEVMDWAGLDERIVTAEHGGTSLSNRNDAGDSFAKIADLIDQYL